MSAVEAGFEEFLRQALSIIDLLIFYLFPSVFVSWRGSTESFVLVVSLLNALTRDHTVELSDIQVSCLMVHHF